MGKKNVVSIEDRIPSLKQERKKKANRRLIFYVSIFFVLIAIIVYLQSPLSHVRTIAVSGNSFVSDETVIEQSGIATNSNIWTVGESDARQMLKQNPVIRKAEVNRQLPWTIKIKVREHTRVGYTMQNDKYYPVLGNGRVLNDMTGKERTLTGEAPLLLGFSDKGYLKDMTQELKNLPKSILRLISEIHWQPGDKNERKIVLYMNDGNMVDGTIRNFAENMSVYPSIVSQLKPEKEGILHLGAGAYFQEFSQAKDTSTGTDSGS